MKKLDYYDAIGLISFYVIVIMSSLELRFSRPSVAVTLQPVILLVVIFSISGLLLVVAKLLRQERAVPIKVVLVLVLAMSLPLFPFMFINVIENFVFGDVAIIAHIAAWMTIVIQELLTKEN